MGWAGVAVAWLEVTPSMGLPQGQDWVGELFLCEISTKVSGIAWLPWWELVPTPGYIWLTKSMTSNQLNFHVSIAGLPGPGDLHQLS